MIQCVHSGRGPLKERIDLTSLLVQELDLDDGRQVFLQETALSTGLLLRAVGCPPQSALEVPPENKE